MFAILNYYVFIIVVSCLARVGRVALGAGCYLSLRVLLPSARLLPIVNDFDTLAGSCSCLREIELSRRELLVLDHHLYGLLEFSLRPAYT